MGKQKHLAGRWLARHPACQCFLWGVGCFIMFCFFVICCLYVFDFFGVGFLVYVSFYFIFILYVFVFGYVFVQCCILCFVVVVCCFY